ncbi:hypothetical protein ACXYMT_13445 [Salinimicrobium sp. CAU 1759]
MVRRNPELEEAIKTLGKFFQENKNRTVNPFIDINPFARIAESIKILQEEAPGSLIELSKYGWYLGYDSLPKTPIELNRKLKNGDEKEVDEFLSEYYQKELSLVERRLIKRNPARKKLIEEGFHNHRKKNYYSSITLLLTQADGLCYDRANKFYFQNDSDLKKAKIFRPAIHSELAKDEGMFFKTFLAPMNNPSAINELIKNIENFPVRLNRHEIIHGIDIEFGTEINSLKTISFLNYLNDVLHDKTGPNSG